VVGCMSEQNHFVASDATVGQNHKPNRKEPKQISLNLGATNRLPCAFFLTKAGTLIFKVSADCFNFKYSMYERTKPFCG
jgi:hypothetical protein